MNSPVENSMGFSMSMFRNHDDMFAAMRDEIRKLRALAPTWQPIETAPRDSAFLAVNAGSIERLAARDPSVVITTGANSRAFVCHSVEDEETGERCFIDEFGEQYGADGRIYDAEDLVVADDVLRLTLWVPLPEPPK